MRTVHLKDLLLFLLSDSVQRREAEEKEGKIWQTKSCWKCSICLLWPPVKCLIFLFSRPELIKLIKNSTHCKLLAVCWKVWLWYEDRTAGSLSACISQLLGQRGQNKSPGEPHTLRKAPHNCSMSETLRLSRDCSLALISSIINTSSSSSSTQPTHLEFHSPSLLQCWITNKRNKQAFGTNPSEVNLGFMERFKEECKRAKTSLSAFSFIVMIKIWTN